MTPAPKLVECSTVDDLTNIVFKEIYNPLSSNGHLSQQQQVRLHGWKLAAEVYLRLALPWIGVPCENYHKTGRYYFAASERKAVRDELKYLSRQVAKKSITSPEQLVSSSRYVSRSVTGIIDIFPPRARQPLFGAARDDRGQPIMSVQPYSIVLVRSPHFSPLHRDVILSFDSGSGQDRAPHPQALPYMGS